MLLRLQLKSQDAFQQAILLYQQLLRGFVSIHTALCPGFMVSRPFQELNSKDLLSNALADVC